MAWLDHLALICQGCGQLKTESMDPAMARGYEAVPLTCYGCKAKDGEQRRADKLRDQYTDDAFDGAYIAVQKRPLVERAE